MLGLRRHLPRDLSVGRDVEAFASGHFTVRWWSMLKISYLARDERRVQLGPILDVQVRVGSQPALALSQVQNKGIGRTTFNSWKRGSWCLSCFNEDVLEDVHK